MHAVLLSPDLMLISAAQGAADRHAITLAVAASSEQAIALCSDATGLLLIDLRTPGLNVGPLVPRVREIAKPPAVVIACGPHVHAESLAAAAAAGCDEVITRGQFDRRIDGLMAALTARAAKGQAAGQ